MTSNLNKVFKENLKVNMRSISVKTLMSDRNLERIDYKPYYQRNYVWDNVKSTFFIESILLGTDIPPLIFFKSGKKIEVIDGRQRFETIKRFKESSFKLVSQGLMELKVLKDQNFNTLSSEIKDAFLDTKVRLFEFEVVNAPDLTPDIEDKIKKEIFRRYNTGITPINSMELDNAKYDNDSLTDTIKNELNNEPDFISDIKNCFFSNKKSKSDIQPSAITDFIRRFITMSSFPIYSYAASANKTDIRELLYETITNQIDDHNAFFVEFSLLLKKVILIHKNLSHIEELNNKLVYECLLWGFSVLNLEGINIEINQKLIDKISSRFKEKIELFSSDGAHYYSGIVDRYTFTANFLSDFFDIKLNNYIKHEDFKNHVKKLNQTEEDGLIKMNSLDKLRFLKPEPSSEPIEEIISDLKTTKYTLRPSYQRQERINIKKASSIIESILLGIYLPPLFIFKNKDGVKEVIDGQQRILSILAFMGKEFLNEKGEREYAKINNFPLKNLKIMSELDGLRFSDLPENYSEKIYDFDLNIIEIDYKLNADFDPVDLFIRLNNKPYPIKENSFEMWNSTIDHEIAKKIKDITNKYIDWFYFRVVKKDRISDRMENEEMITVLSYIDYLEHAESNVKGVDFYRKQDRLNCRISNKSGITSFLNSLESNPKKKNEFNQSIDRTEKFILKITKLLNENNTEILNKLNQVLNVKDIQAFKRSLQDIYLLWILINKVDSSIVTSRREEIIIDFRNLMCDMKNTSNQTVDDDYVINFKEKLERTVRKYT